MQGELKMARAQQVQRGLEQTAAPLFNLKRRYRLGETIIQGFLFACGAISILTTVGIIFVLGEESWLFFRNAEVSIVEFFTGIMWQPAILRFGIWPLVIATLTTSIMAMLVALPLGLMIAIYLSEYASPRIRKAVKPVLEVLAGVPTVVYGYFALTFMTPLLQQIFGKNVVEVYNNASAGIVIGLVILIHLVMMLN